MGVPPSPLPNFPIMLSACLGIKPWRCHRASLLALSLLVLTYVGWFKKKMAERRSLGCLSSYVNVKGEEAVRRRVRPERTHVQRVAMRMAERREETWTPMNRKRASAFIQMYFLALVDRENAYRHSW